MTQLYKLSEQHRELQKFADSGEMTMEELKDTFEGIESSFQEKSISLVHVIMNLSTADIDSEIERLQKRKKAIDNSKERAREYLRTNMEASGFTKIDCPLFNITLAKGRDVLVIDNADDIPDDFIEVTVTEKPNKAAILARIKSGEDVNGCRIEKSKTSLRIK